LFYNILIMKIENKRIILKLSGEAIGESGSILNKEKLYQIVGILKQLNSGNAKVGVVIGAGNIFRGRISSSIGVDTISGDYMGMVGTVINLKALSSLLTQNNIKNILFSSLFVEDVAVKYDKDIAKKYFEEGYVVLLAGGIGKPNYTTDTCAALRAIELDCNLILSGKYGVDGVYDCDPNTNKNAKFLKNLTYKEALDRDLKVMDKSALDLLKDTNVITRVFSMEDMSNFIKVIYNNDIGSTISKE